MSEFTRLVLVLRLSRKWIGRGVNQFKICQILHLIGPWYQHDFNTVLTPRLNSVNSVLIPPID